jgi:hypothetical protein
MRSLEINDSRFVFDGQLTNMSWAVEFPDELPRGMQAEMAHAIIQELDLQFNLTGEESYEAQLVLAEHLVNTELFD